MSNSYIQDLGATYAAAAASKQPLLVLGLSAVAVVAVVLALLLFLLALLGLLALAQGETKVELQLTPENLGKVTIELRFGQTGNLECILMAAEKQGLCLAAQVQVCGVLGFLLGRSGLHLYGFMMRAFGQRYGEEVRVEIQQPQESQQEQQQTPTVTVLPTRELA